MGAVITRQKCQAFAIIEIAQSSTRGGPASGQQGCHGLGQHTASTRTLLLQTCSAQEGSEPHWSEAWWLQKPEVGLSLSSFHAILRLWCFIPLSCPHPPEIPLLCPVLWEASLQIGKLRPRQQSLVKNLPGTYLLHGGLLETRPLDGLWADENTSDGGDEGSGSNLPLPPLPLPAPSSSSIFHPPQTTAAASPVSPCCLQPSLCSLLHLGPWSLASCVICQIFIPQGLSSRPLLQEALLDYPQKVLAPPFECR